MACQHESVAVTESLPWVVEGFGGTGADRWSLVDPTPCSRVLASLVVCFSCSAAY